MNSFAQPLAAQCAISQAHLLPAKTQWFIAFLARSPAQDLICCDEGSHGHGAKPGIFCAQASYLHLFKQDFGTLVIAASAAELTLGNQPYPVAQAGLGDAKNPGRHRIGLTGAHLPHRLQLELLRVMRTHLLVCHLLTPCRYFQQVLGTPLFRGKLTTSALWIASLLIAASAYAKSARAL